MLVPARAVFGALMLIVAVAPATLPADEVRGPGIDMASGTPVELCGVAQIPDQGRASRQKVRRGVLGWLYRYTRNIDLERAGGSRLPGFLRSPLLGSLPGRAVECDPVPALDEPTTCAIVSLDPGGDAERNVAVPLPQMGVTTPSALADRIHEKLAMGDWVSLRTRREETIRFDRERVRYVEAKACRKDA